MQEQWERTIPCRDRAGRQREAKVLVTDSAQVVFIAPPGEAAMFHPGDVNRIKQALTDAQMEAVHRRGGGR